MKYRILKEGEFYYIQHKRWWHWWVYSEDTPFGPLDHHSLESAKKALVHMHSVYKSTTDLLSFQWVCGLFGYSIRLSVEIEAEPVKSEKGLVKI